MQIRKIDNRKKCDCYGCDNFADFSIDKKGIFNKEFNICECCLKTLFKSYIGTTIPRVVESPFKPKSKIIKEKKWKRIY